MPNETDRFPVAQLLLALSLLVSAASLAESPPSASAETTALVAKLGLHEAEHPVRESKEWHKPALIVVLDPGNAQQREWLQAAAPGTRLVFASDAAGALQDAPKADA